VRFVLWNGRKHYGTGTSRLRYAPLTSNGLRSTLCEGSHAIRATILRSQTTTAALSGELGINVKTVAKWRKRETIEDRKTGPTEPSLTVLIADEEAMITAFRRDTLLPLDDCLYALQPTIPHLTRPSLHRCLQRHGISRQQEINGDKPKRQKFKRYPIGYFHIDIAELRTNEGKLYLFCHLSDFLDAYNYARRLKALSGLTPYEYICKIWTSGPDRFILNPIHQMLELNTQLDLLR
jgi:hypothetical protein